MLTILLTDAHGSVIQFSRPLFLSLLRADDAPADGITIRLPITRPLPEITRICVRYGEDILFNGITDEQTETYSDNSAFVTIKGRSMEALLLDNEALPQTYCLPSFGLLFARHFRELGFSGYRADDKSYNGEFVISKGTSEWGVLVDFCNKFSHTSPVITNDGIIDISGSYVPDTIRVSKAILISLSRRLNRSTLVSDIIARTYPAGGYNMTFHSNKAEAIDVRRKRYVNAVGHKVNSITDIDALIRKSESAYQTITAQCSGCIHCLPGDHLLLEDDSSCYRIKEVQLTVDAAGEKTTIFAEVTNYVDQQKSGSQKA